MLAGSKYLKVRPGVGKLNLPYNHIYLAYLRVLKESDFSTIIFLFCPNKKRPRSIIRSSNGWIHIHINKIQK